MRKMHRYADGGKVVKDHLATAPKKPRRKPKPSDLGSGLAARAGSILRDRRKQQMKELGI